MFQHADLAALEFLLQNPQPQNFESFLKVFCRNLHFEGALIYRNIGTAEKLPFFAGIIRGNPVTKVQHIFPFLEPRNLPRETLMEAEKRTVEIEFSNATPKAQKLMEEYNIRKLFFIPISGNTRNYGIVVALSETPRQLSKEELKILKTHTLMLSLLLDIFHIKWTYDVVRNNITEHVVIQDLDHRILEANRAASMSLGIEDPDSIKGKYCYELWHHRNTPCTFCPLEITRKTLKSEENEVMTPDGRWYYIRSNPIFSGSGDLAGFVELTLEVTEKKKAEHEAARFQKILNKLYNQPLVGVALSSYDGKIIDANETRAKFLGYSREELLKMNWTQYTHEDDAPILFERLRELREKKTDYFVEDVRCINKNGMQVWQRLYVVPLEIDSEELLLTMIVDISEDVSLRRRLEELLRERETILNSIPQKIYKVNLNGNAVRVTSKIEGLRKFSDIIKMPDEKTKEILKQTIRGVTPVQKIEYEAEAEKEKKFFIGSLSKLDESSSLFVENDVTEIKQQELEALELTRKYRKLTEGILTALSHLTELKEPYTAGHQARVSRIAVLVGKKMGLSEKTLKVLEYAGLLHDIGKLIIPIEILNKPGKVSFSEFDLIRSHPQFGFEILKDIEFEGPVAEITLQHHERLDGSGYPAGLKGDQIILETRIISCADVFEAMTSHRPYRAAQTPERALEELEGKAGVLYDSNVVKIMRELFEEGLLPTSLY